MSVLPTASPGMYFREKILYNMPNTSGGPRRAGLFFPVRWKWSGNKTDGADSERAKAEAMMKKQEEWKTGNRNQWELAIISLALLLALSTASGCKNCLGGPAPEPVKQSSAELVNPNNLALDPAIPDLVNAYYRAVNLKEPEAACKLRLACTDTDRDTVRTGFGVSLTRITINDASPDRASLLAEGIETHGDGGKTGFKQFLNVSKQGEEWKVEALGAVPPKPIVTAPESGPEDAIKSYFKALDEKDLKTFCALQLECGDTAKRMLMRREGMALEKSEVKSKDAKTATVHTESTETFSDGAKAHWKQDWFLQKVKGEWKIETTGNVVLEEGGAGETKSEGPVAVIKKYYEALDKKDVEAACAIELTCSDTHKRTIRYHKPISLTETTLKSSQGDRAVVHTVSVEVDPISHTKTRWSQDWPLKKVKGQWRVGPPENYTSVPEKE